MGDAAVGMRRMEAGSAEPQLGRSRKEIMTLCQLEEACDTARQQGAKDETPVYAVSERMRSMRDIKSVEFQNREGWPEKEWPVAINIEEKS